MNGRGYVHFRLLETFEKGIKQCFFVFRIQPKYHFQFNESNSKQSKSISFLLQLSVQILQLYLQQFSIKNYSIVFSIIFSMLKERSNLMKKQTPSIMSTEDQLQKVRLLGQGTFGKVYLDIQVINKRTQIEYALKQVVQQPQYKNRELSIISQLSHYSIIQIKDYFYRTTDRENTLYMFMECMDTSLATILKDLRKLKQRMSPIARKLIAFQLIKGLAYLEIKNVCHRDLKPPNLLINANNYQLKICDFGSAKIIEVRENNVSYICSRYYRAPELILNSTTYACEIDMWSAGCMLVELMTLEPIFPGDSSIEQLIEIIKILGTPSNEQVLSFSAGNDALQLPKVKGSDWDRILKRYNPSELEIDLIEKILTYDAAKRIKPLEALKHPYFADLATYPEVQKLPLLFEFQSLRTKRNKKSIVELQNLYSYYQQSYQANKQNNQNSLK